MSWYQKGKPIWILLKQRDSEWQWHQLGHMQVCISLQTDDNHAITPPLNFLQAGCPSCHPTNSTEGTLSVINCSFYFVMLLYLICVIEFTEQYKWFGLFSTVLQKANHASTPPLSFSQAGCPSCRPTNSVKALKARYFFKSEKIFYVTSHVQ